VCRPFFCRCTVSVWLFPCPVLALAQNERHPLSALTTEEYWTIYDVVQASASMDEDTHFASILLHEPGKASVLAWPGQG